MRIFTSSDWKKCLRALLTAAVFLVQTRTPISAQQGEQQTDSQQAPRPGSFVVQAQTNVVLVDVRVWDKSGKPVTDLTEKDFKVWEDGKPQTISSFSVENIENLAQASEAGGQPAVLDLGKLPPNVPQSVAVQDHRLLVLFFDLSSMQPDDLIRSLKSATEFVKARVTPADLVAIVTYSSNLRIVQNFTNSPDSLAKALNGILVGEESSYLASGGTTGEAGTTSATGEEVVTQDVSDAFTPDETEFNIFNTDEKLAAIESLSAILRKLPGRKSVIHFTSGIQRTGTENQAQLRATVDAANQANVSLYTVDSRGLVALPPGGDASTASPSANAIYSGSAVASQVSSLQGGRETLASLATDTGGRMFYDLNDLSSAFQEVQRENSSYYLLGYTPTDTRSNGRFRRIKVTVERPGVNVQARPGYFAPKNFRQFTREDKEVQLEQAMNLDLPFLDLPFVVDTAYFQRPDKTYYVVLAAKIPGSAVQFMQKSNAHATEFDFAWRATDPSGKPVGMLRDTLPVKVAGESYDQLMAGNFLYEGGMILPPGDYHLKVVVRGNITGKMGTFEQPLKLPPLVPNGLMLSTVVLSNEVKAGEGKGRKRKSGEEDNPLERGEKAILPSVTRVFRTNQNLYIFLESYAAKSAPKDETQAATAPAPPSVGLAFFRRGAKMAEAGPFPGKALKSGGQKATYLVQLPLEKFPIGRYVLQVNVLDPTAQSVAFVRVPLAIVKPPARPAPTPVPTTTPSGE